MGLNIGRTATAIALVLALGAGSAMAQTPPPKSYAETIAPMARQDGLLPLFVDQAGGRVLIQLPPAASDGIMARVIHHTALRTGVGSAVTGLDRAQIGATNILAFRRIGKRVVAEFENPKYRAAAGSADEQAAARDAFVGSTVWAGDVVATAPDGSVLIDIAGFLTRDAHGIVETLRRAGQGTLRPVADLTLVDPAQARSFPENLELEARLTFAVEGPGPVLNQIAPDARLVDLHRAAQLHQTAGRRLSAAPLRSAHGGDQHPGHRLLGPAGRADRQPPGQPVPAGEDRPDRRPLHRRRADRLLCRSRRPRADPHRPCRGRTVVGPGVRQSGLHRCLSASTSCPKVSIRLDARYNVINWVNRATRSWSYGQSVVDPRTGEIVKGSVLLGSLRIRQDMLIFEGPGRGRPDRDGWARTTLSALRWPASGSCRPTRSAMPSACCTISRPAPRIGPR